MARLPVGRRLGKTFLDAGLPFPTIAAEILIGGGAGSYVYPWLANTLISVAPRLAQLGLSLPPGVAADHSLADRMEEEAARHGGQNIAPTQFGAWISKALARVENASCFSPGVLRRSLRRRDALFAP